MGEAGKVKMTWWQAQIEAYQQQESWVWRPVYTVHTMWWPFLGMGCVMFVLGLGMMSVQGNYNEIVWDYTECYCNQTGVAADTKAMDYLNETGKSCTCKKELNITEESDHDQAKWDRDILIYYGLDNFHQNHRQYADSRDDKQLNGKRLNAKGNPDIPDFDCEAPNHSDNKTGLPILPCGSIANSFFNDKVSMSFKNSSCKLQPISLLKTGIAMPFDKKRFNNPVDDSELPKLKDLIKKPETWANNLWELDQTDPSNNGLENEDLIVWMRSAPLGNFRKLWRRIDHNDKKHIELKDGLHTGYMYTVEIDYNYDVSGFNGRKKVIITRANPLGAKNKMRGYIAMAAAMFFYFFSALFFLLARTENSSSQKN